MDKKEKMFPLVDQWRKSGLTRKVFAQQQGITDASFEYWCRKRDNEMVRPPVSHPGFVELAPNPETSRAVPGKTAIPQVELSLPGGLVIKIY
jgi:hypothetical protein